MAEYNAKLHVKTSTGYDDINLQTKGKIVSFDNSETDLTSEDVDSVIKEVNNNKLDKKSVVNNLSTDDESKALSASMGKKLNEDISNLFKVTNGKGIINSSVLDSSTSACDWIKSGNVCQVSFVLKSKLDVLPDNSILFSGLPKAVGSQKFSYHAINNTDPVYGFSRNGYLMIDVDGNIHEFYYYKPEKGVDCKGGFTYICQP